LWVYIVYVLHKKYKYNACIYPSQFYLNDMKSNATVAAATLDVAALEKALENENNASISSLTTRKIVAEKMRQLQQLGFNPAVLADYAHKLRDYRHVDDLNGLMHGAYIRWIDLKDPDKLALARGAIICDIKIGQKGVHLLCKTHPSPAMFHVVMDEVVIFQRLSQQERVILAAMDYLDDDADNDDADVDTSSDDA
jgi:hypothetical protein